MIDFIKGEGILDYQTLLEQKPEYGSAFYLDTTTNRLYINGNPVDARIVKRQVPDDELFVKNVYDFSDDEGNTVSIDETKIPELVDSVVTIRNMETGEDYEYNNGLMPVIDKVLIEALAKIVGVSYTYEYYANVNHIKSSIEGDFTTMTDVDVRYDNEQNSWVYDYDAFEYTGVDGEGITHTYTHEAGIRLVDDSDVKIKAIRINKSTSELVMFDAGGRPDDTTVIADYGGIRAGTTVAELKQLTVSEILSRILLQQAHLVKIQEQKAYLKYTEDYAPGGIVRVGQSYPTINDFELIFEPEKWQLISDVTNEPIGEPIIMTRVDSVEYFLHDLQHPTVIPHRPYDPDNDIYNLITDAEYYADHIEHYAIEPNDKCVYWAVVNYVPIDSIEDLMGSVIYVDPITGESILFPTIEPGSIKTNELRFNNENAVVDTNTGEVIFSCPIYIGFDIQSNASEISENSLWETRNIEPDSPFEGNDYMIGGAVAFTNRPFYLKWPSELTPNDRLYVYIPTIYTITSLGGAHDFITEDFSIELPYNIVNSTVETVDEETGEIVVEDSGEPLIVEVTNVAGSAEYYYKYNIGRQVGITTVKITIKSIAETDEP